MKEKIHNFRVFLSNYKIPIAFVISCIIFFFFITNFPSSGRRGVALFIGISEIVGIPFTVFLISAIWFGLMYLFLDYYDDGSIEKKKKEMDEEKYEDLIQREEKNNLGKKITVSDMKDNLDVPRLKLIKEINLLYPQVALELEDREKIKIDVWNKALLEAKGNQGKAKLKYIEIRIEQERKIKYRFDK